MTLVVVTEVVAELLNLRAVLTPSAAAARSVRTVGPVLVPVTGRAVELGRLDHEVAGREVGQVGVVGLDVGDDLGGCHLAGAELPADPVAGFQDAGVGAGDMRSAPHDSNELLLDGVGAGRCGQSEGGGTQCSSADQSGADQHLFEHWFSLLDCASMPR